MKAILLSLLALIGCAPQAEVLVQAPATGPITRPATRPFSPIWGVRPVWTKPVIYLTLCADVSGGEEEWAANFRNILPEAPVVVVVHGEYAENTWCAIPDIGDVIPVSVLCSRVARKYPGQSHVRLWVT